MRHCECGNITVTGSAVSSCPCRCARVFMFDSEEPVLRIHTAAIHIETLCVTDVAVLNSRHIDVGCRRCGQRLIVYASKKGAFCQFQVGKNMIGTGSLPSDVFVDSSIVVPIPKSILPLFREREMDTLLFENPRNFSENDGEFGCEDEDYDLMFSNRDEPFVGSYTEVGLFATDNNYLVFADHK